MKNNVLILFTGGYPFGTGEVFIEPEIEYLHQGFDKIIIVSNDTESRTCRPLPEDIVLIRYSDQLGSLEKLASLKQTFASEYSGEAEVIKKLYKQPLSPIIRKTLLVCLQTGVNVVKLIRQIVKEHDLKDYNLFLYSFWNNNMAYGIAKYRQENPEVVAFTRAHRWDIFFEESVGNYLPMRSFILDNLNAIFFSSTKGKEYFASKMGVSSDRLKTSWLGVNSSYQQSDIVRHHPLEVMSCSNVIDRKRVDLIVKTLAEVNDFEVIWNHVGDGPGLPALESLAKEQLGDKPNIKFNFVGRLSKDELHNYFETKPVDVFLNLSSSEGVPAIIVESMSFGIPVIATDVGGVSQIVNNDNGVLLSANPGIPEISKAIVKMNSLADNDFSRFKENALKTWSDEYNAEEVYPEFISQVLKFNKA